MKNNPINKFKILLKECIREVIREEFDTLNENIKIQSNPKTTLHQHLKNKFNPNKEIENSGNRPLYLDLPITGNPLIDLLNETKQNMNHEDFQNIGDFKNSEYHSLNESNVPLVENINDIISSHPKTTDINNVHINAVPNYKEFMKKL